MGALRCVDGSVLSVEPVSCRDQGRSALRDHAQSGQGLGAVRGGRPALRLSAIGASRAHQRSPARSRAGGGLAGSGRQVPRPGGRAVKGQHSAAGADAPAGGHDRSAQAAGYLPGDHEYFTLRSRDRADLPGTGELRCVLRSSAVWVGECVGVGQHAQGHHRPCWSASAAWPGRAPYVAASRRCARPLAADQASGHRGLGCEWGRRASCPDFGRTGGILGYGS